MSLNQLEYRIIRDGTRNSYMQTDLVIMYMLDGEMNVTYFGDTLRMRKEDILLINSGVEYEISGIRDAIYGVATYSIDMISRIMEGRSLMLYANSVRDSMHSYQNLRDILQDMTAEYIMHTHQTSAAMDSMMLSLLNCLIENYQLHQGQIEADHSDTDLRMRQMMQYIISHIHEEMSLSDLAGEMFVSTSTLSRMFKKSTGMYFADYVMRLRVRTSLEYLRYSDQNLTQIAMNCGFSTSSAFNRSFKKVTGMMPSEYRKNYQVTAEARQEENRNEQIIREELRKKGYQYNRLDLKEEVTLNMNDLNPSYYKHVWSECINIGSFYEMSRANIQFHVLHLQEQLHFRYVRVWNIFSEKMMVSDGVTVGQYNFDLINQVLVFLVSRHIKPFIDLGRRPDTAIRAQGVEIYYKEEGVRFESREVWEDLVKAFLGEIVLRYGAEEISGWIFELTRDFHTKELKQYEDKNYDFYEVWKFMYTQIHRQIPGAKFGGISTVIESDRDFAENFFKRCANDGYLPDFVSFFLYPYEIVRDEKEEKLRRMTTIHMDLEAERVREMKALMNRVGLGDRRLYLTEWNNSIVNRNYLNDSCFRAAYIVAKSIELWGEADMMSVMAGSDWGSSHIDTNRILNGGIGLLTKDMIAKPAFYALSFLEHMGTHYLSRGDHYLLTKKGRNDYYLLCHNFSWFRQDAVTDSERVDLDKIRMIRYEDERILELKMIIKCLSDPGEYTVKKRFLNKHSGSVLDEWGKLGFEARLNRDDVKYLQAISVPRIEMERIMTTPSGNLEIELKLQPGNVVLLHIYKV